MRHQLSNLKLSNVNTVYFHSAPFLNGTQPMKVRGTDGFEISLIPDFLKLQKGNKVELVPLANVKSISYTEGEDAPKSKS